MSRFTLFAITLFNAVCLATSIRILGMSILLGGDKDAYGCKSSAGYVWCKDTHSCIPVNEICKSEL